ncbi:response regulator [Phenylobacterium aquaticum]|uniref:response regulator n=1 Tax=Phenylobacterium aquaticum TaxID=1763816 RepID=UPI001F5CAEDC|nr:response regulator [Phenylobacterium aquaticum]MCI3130777.1 response regulator [Phenylobacterium aquaticum]
MAKVVRHALVVEDEMIIALEVEILLRDLGLASVDFASSTAEALERAIGRRPDLITADIRIVGGTGIDAIQSIVRQLGTIPHFYVTGNLDMLRDVAAPAVVEKPIDHWQFRRAFEAVVGPILGAEGHHAR